MLSTLQPFKLCSENLESKDFTDLTITNTERFKLKTFAAFMGHKYPQLIVYTCYYSTTELSEEENRQIIHESHGSIMAQHFGEKKSIARARELSIWANMENDIIKFVKSCDICQTQKLTRIIRKCEVSFRILLQTYLDHSH